jgi:MoCo/4Fe-4S cofactor protein with predicted Tat translocation signal
MSKTIPPTCPEPETGRTYWRSLDQVSDTPEFREWLHREFPAGASEMTDPVTRRHFVKIMSASFALAGVGLGLTGCRRPVEKVEPFGKQPEGYIHGVPSFYATAMPTRTGAVPLVAKSHDGRPVKVEGNSMYPGGNGGTDRFAQASILNLYDPDRSRDYVNGNSVSAPEAAFDFLTGISKKFLANQGEGLAILAEPAQSPSRERLLALVNGVMPKAKFFTHDPLDSGAHVAAASQVFGQNVKPTFRYDKAEIIVSLDCDFLGTEEELGANIRRFAASRRIETPADNINRLYVIESLMTLTGANADHRLRVPSSSLVKVASALASAAGVSGVSAEALSGDVAKWVAECAKDLAEHKGKSLVVAGAGQSMAVHALAYAINATLGNLGKTVEFAAAGRPTDVLKDLANDLNDGKVDTLVLLGGNPVYTAPVDLNWAATQRKAKTVVRLGYYRDETSAGCDWHLPLAHYLESWGDAYTAEGVLVPVQPLIAPLFGGLTELEVLARIAGVQTVGSYEIVRETFAGIAGGDVEAKWRKFLHDGFLAAVAPKAVSVSLIASAVTKAIAAATGDVAGGGKLEVVIRPDPKMDDGRFNNNGWMLELPDPVTKVTWDNVISVSRKTASELKLNNNDVIRVEVGGRSVEGPVYVQPGQADDSLGMTLGWGRPNPGRVGTGTGYNAYSIRTSTGRSVLVGATVTKTGKVNKVSCTQEHWSMEGRPIIREANLEQFRQHPDFVNSLNMHMPPAPKGEKEWPKSLYPNPLDEAMKSAHHQWGMSIDLNMCVGCSACVLACQSENNIPIVGKDQVNRGREMHWLRLDRYYTTVKDTFTKKPAVPGRDETQQYQDWIDNVQVVNQPMLCQHCEAAPCESVCPVNATAHDNEGLNVMAYNRCVGTRYCSNNCPYKVRRFNFFDYNKRPNDYGKVHKGGPLDLGNLYKGPFKTRPDDEWDLLKMAKNPEVTVRMRGVMEKCTFCLQRIESAKIATKVKAGASGNVVVPTDSFTTACAQACPAGAIVFGNIADPESRVTKLKAQSRDYSVLEFLLTKPRLTYLAKVRNPNKAMPDYYEAPNSLQEYGVKMHTDNPFEGHHGGGHEAGHEAAGAGHAAEQKGAH